MMKFPTEWKVIKFMFQTTNQFSIIYPWFFSQFPHIFPLKSHIFPPLGQPHRLRAIRQLQAAAGAASHPAPGLARFTGGRFNI
jgi:hypothetical protein